MGKRVFFANPPTGNVQDLSDKGIIVFENLINDLILEKDTSAPTITIKGNNPLTVMQNGQYSDAGVEVVDNRDPKPKLSISSSNPIYTGISTGLRKGTLRNRMDKTTPNPGNLGIEALGTGDSEKGLNEGGSAWADNTTIVYTGQIYDEDGRMSFYENIDDEAWLEVTVNSFWIMPLGTPQLPAVLISVKVAGTILNFDSEMVLVEQVLRVLVEDPN